MTAYARSDVISVFLPESGHIHTRDVTKKAKAAKVDRKGREVEPSESAEYAKEFAVSCEPCATILLRDHKDQWANRADKVPLTPDEVDEKERLTKEGSILTRQMAEALGREAVERVRREAAEAAGTPA